MSRRKRPTAFPAVPSRDGWKGAGCITSRAHYAGHALRTGLVRSPSSPLPGIAVLAEHSYSSSAAMTRALVKPVATVSGLHAAHRNSKPA